MLFFISCFSTFLILLWAISGFLHSFYTFSPAYCRVIRNTFILTFLGLSVTVLRGMLRNWETIFYVQAFFPYTSSRNLAQSTFIKAFLGAGSSSLKVPRPPTEVWNADPVHLLVRITQCSAKGISCKVLFKGYNWSLNEESPSNGIWTNFRVIGEHVKSLMLYLFGHRAIQSEIN